MLLFLSCVEKFLRFPTYRKQNIKDLKCTFWTIRHPFSLGTMQYFVVANNFDAPNDEPYHISLKEATTICTNFVQTHEH